jgi:23S rRNA (cytosine1962-C5)-methyltransferase
MEHTRPTLRLKPKTDAKRIRHGFPWVYADDLVLDRRARTIPAGSWAELQDSDRTPLALVTVNTASRIAARVMDADPSTQINATWLEARIASALALRAALFDTPFYRLIHAEGDSLPGVIVDRFDDTLVIQPNAAWAQVHLDLLAECLSRVTGCSTVYKNASGRARAAEDLDDVSGPLIGAPPARVTVPMNGALYIADLTGGQKTGLFYDQRPNHAFAAPLARGGRVLDVFSHVGGFGLAALAAGATSALAVDGSAPALDLATEGAALMGRAADFTTRKGDAFDTMAALAAEGQTFDLVVADPPAFAPAKSAMTAGLRAYERVARLAAGLVKPGGFLVLCSCSHAVDLDKFRAACIRGMGRAGRPGALIHTGFAGPDHPMHPQLAETSYLKALVFHCP